MGRLVEGSRKRKKERVIERRCWKGTEIYLEKGGGTSINTIILCIIGIFKLDSKLYD